VSRRRRNLIATTVVLVALGTIAVGHARRLRYAALPMLADPSLAPPPRQGLAVDDELRAAQIVTRLPARVTAIAELANGVLFVATFDAGLHRYDARRDRVPVAVAELAGRERFVDALLPFSDGVVAGTHRGALVLDKDGRRRAVLAAGETVTALANVDGQLLIGTPHGLYAGERLLALHGPDGERVRVTALAVSSRRLYLGSPSGLYSLPLPLDATAELVAAWQPLVFGTPGAASNVVTALAPVAGGVVAGTDDGGVALVTARGVRGLAFTDAGANDVNPGAIASRAGRVIIGTQGGGIVSVDGDGDNLRAARPASWAWPRISAVAAGARFVGTDDGHLLALAN
jgi:ligand-binding sensor domain-containing protein